MFSTQINNTATLYNKNTLSNIEHKLSVYMVQHISLIPEELTQIAKITVPWAIWW